MRGGRLGAYEILRHVGHGATASVFEGRHVALGKQVAIKVLHEHLASDAQVAARFLREGRVAAQLRHPNVLD
ncbi:protein kinase, partial [Pseudomonas sp. MPR-AND1A]|uniref:protein kinase domain-containing protein n=1 Tax=Pseudomonas sp. MPR-AND1A TaxID=2070600 RepID=UPI000CC04952